MEYEKDEEKNLKELDNFVHIQYSFINFEKLIHKIKIDKLLKRKSLIYNKFQ